MLESLSGRAMIIGVDRLDYSKGLPERMNAFERFLTNFPDWRGNVTYLQITPRSRAGIPNMPISGARSARRSGASTARFGEAVMDAAALHQQGAQPHRSGRALPRRARRRW